MQDYYNIPYMASGGTLATLAGSIKYLQKFITDAKNLNRLKMLGISISKKNSQLSLGIKNLVEGKLDEKGLEELQKLAKQHYVKTSNYQSRLKSIQDALRYRKQALDLLKKTEKSESKVVGAAANPIPGTTLAGRWNQLKTWMNNHPKTTIGVPLLALGTGSGRYVTGNAFKFTQSNPESWFGDSAPELKTPLDFIMINGTKIPIKRSAEGYFVPVNQNNDQNNQSPLVKGSGVDQTLAGITNENLESTPQQQPENMPQVNQQAINDLFDDDQW